MVWLWGVGWGGVWLLGGVVPWGRWGGAAALGAFPGQLMLFVVSCVTWLRAVCARVVAVCTSSLTSACLLRCLLRFVAGAERHCVRVTGAS